MMEKEIDQSRRGFIIKVAYAAPAIATLSVLPSIASAGSAQHQRVECRDDKQVNYSQVRGFQTLNSTGVTHHHRHHGRH
jgi:hypothetical protein